MNKGQWYVWGGVFLAGAVMSIYSQIRFASLPIETVDVTYAVYSGLYLVLGSVCGMGAVACFICGLLEKENV